MDHREHDRLSEILTRTQIVSRILEDISTLGYQYDHRAAIEAYSKLYAMTDPKTKGEDPAECPKLADL